MTDIKNTDYTTINQDGIFVGGKPAITYRGKRITGIADMGKYFADIQKLNPDVAELHVLSSETGGKFAVAGNPSEKHGPNAWCRVKFNDGRMGLWIFNVPYRSAVDCAQYSAISCVSFICDSEYDDFRSAVFKGISRTENTYKKPWVARLVEKLKNRQH